MPTQQVPLVSPIKGVVRAVGRESQPLETCWDAQNCLPYDRYGRKRLAQRPGLAKEYPTQMSDNFVQGMLEAPAIIYPPGTISTPIPGLSDLPGYPTSFMAPGTIGPLSGPPSPGAFAPWTWTFQITAANNAGHEIPQTLIDSIFFQTTSAAYPNQYGIVLYVSVTQNSNSGTLFTCEIDVYEGLLSGAPVPDSVPHLPPAGAAPLLAFPDIVAQADPAAWNFQLNIAPGGATYILYDLTDLTNSGTQSFLTPVAIIPVPYLISASYDANGNTPNPTFAITD